MKKLDKVLLVDDDNINNFLNARLFKKMQISKEVKIANDGEEALDYLKSSSKSEAYPQLILLDINMPRMNGLDFLNAFEKKNLRMKKPVIIVLSTSDNIGDMTIMTNSDLVDGYLHKPLTEEKITVMLKQYFG